MPLCLHTPRLVLRPVTEDDLDAYFAYAGDAELCRFMLGLPHPTREAAREALAYLCGEWYRREPAVYAFAIVHHGDHIGGVTLTPYADGSAEIGWILRRDTHGFGYALEAAEAVRDFAFSRGFCRLSAHCDARNEASRRLMERLGMTRVPVPSLRPYTDEAGQPVEELCFTLASDGPRTISNGNFNLQP